MSDNTIVRQEFLNMEDFGKMQQVAEFFVKNQALPKGVDNAGKLVMIMQAGRDLGLSVTQAMSGLAIINGVVTAYGAVAAVLMKRAGRNWTVETTEQKMGKKKDEKGVEKEGVQDLIKRIKIWKGDDETKAVTIEYKYSEAVKAGIVKNDPWVKYTDDMLYWKCLARARKQVCPEVLDGVAMYEDYQEIEGKASSPVTTTPTGDIIDSLELRIENCQSEAELKELMDEVRKSGNPKMVSVYANKQRSLQSQSKKDDTIIDATIVGGDDEPTNDEPVDTEPVGTDDAVPTETSVDAEDENATGISE